VELAFPDVEGAGGMQRDHGKRLWASLLRRRGAEPDVIVFSDPGDGRGALSLATAVAGVFGLPREPAIYRADDPGAKATRDIAPALPASLPDDPADAGGGGLKSGDTFPDGQPSLTHLGPSSLPSPARRHALGTTR
jgi:hypothetical protein